MGSVPLERADPSFFVPSKWAIQALTRIAGPHKRLATLNGRRVPDVRSAPGL
jgi:hypothetical protein